MLAILTPAVATNAAKGASFIMRLITESTKDAHTCIFERQTDGELGERKMTGNLYVTLVFVELRAFPTPTHPYAWRMVYSRYTFTR